MARQNTITFLSTTRAALNTQASATGLIAGEPYFITDEGRFALATSTSAYQDFAKLSEVGAGGGSWGSITGTLSDQTDLQTALDAKAPKSVPTFTGQVTVNANDTLLTFHGPALNNTLATLYEGASGGLEFETPTGTMKLLGSTGVSLHHAGSLKLKTLATGASVTGDFSASGNLSATNLTGTNTGDETYSTITTKLAGGSGGGTTNFLRADGTFAAPPSGGSAAWGSITGTLSDQTDLQTALNAKAPLASPTFSGTVTAGVINHATGVGLQYNGLTKLVTGTGGVTITGTITANNHLTTMSGFCSGKPVNSEVVAGQIFPVATTITAANCTAKATAAATASTVFTIKKNNSSTVGTITFAAAATLATVSITAGSVSANDYLTVEAPASADATLANIAFLVRA